MVEPNREYYRLRSIANGGVIFFAIIFLLLSAAVPSRADDRAAMLHPMGSVTVNEVSVARPTPVFVGDRIATGNGGTATIISEGTQVSLSGNSEIVYTDHEIIVLQNRAVISTLRGVSARSGSLKVTPDGASAVQFELSRGESATEITATSGSVSVNDGTSNHQINAGNSYSASTAQSFAAGASHLDLFASTVANGEGRSPFPADCPPRRCSRPPESRTHPCQPGHGGGPGYGNDDDGDGNGNNGGDCNCQPPPLPPPPPPPHHGH